MSSSFEAGIKHYLRMHSSVPMMKMKEKVLQEVKVNVTKSLLLYAKVDAKILLMSQASGAARESGKNVIFIFHDND